MDRIDIRLGRFLHAHLEGIRLDLAAHLLPGRTRLSFGLGPHVHLRASAQRQLAVYSTNPDEEAVIAKARAVGMDEGHHPAAGRHHRSRPATGVGSAQRADRGAARDFSSTWLGVIEHAPVAQGCRR